MSGICLDLDLRTRPKLFVYYQTQKNRFESSLIRMVSMLVWLYGSNFRKNRISEQMNERWQNSSHQSEFAQNDFIELSSLRSICISICVTNNNYIASAFTFRNIDWCFLLSYELKSMNVIDMDLNGNMAVTVIDAMRCEATALQNRNICIKHIVKYSCMNARGKWDSGIWKLGI